MKKSIKIIIDILMTLTLLFLMGFQFWSIILHEAAGAMMLFLFILHNILNYPFYKNLFKGRYSILRVLFLLVDFSLLASMLLSMISGIAISSYIFTFVSVPMNNFQAHTIHLSSTFWTFVLTAVHAGLHFAMIFKKLNEKIKLSKILFLISIVVKISIIIFGYQSFVKRRFLDFMLLRTHFAFMDIFESKIIFYCEYLAIALAFAFITDFICTLLKKSKL